jgi:hypothetical protein
MRQVNGRVYEFGLAGGALYLTNGDTADWSFGTSGIPSYTIELPPVDELRGGFFNAETEILPIFRENLPAMLYLIEWAARNASPGSPNPEQSSASAAPERGHQKD